MAYYKYLLPLLLAFSTTLEAATFIVTNGNNSGAGSLRQALLDANNNPGTDDVNFNYNGTITITSSIPISGSVNINNNQPNLIIAAQGAINCFEVVQNGIVVLGVNNLANCSFSGLSFDGFASVFVGNKVSQFSFQNIQTQNCTGIELDISEAIDITVNTYQSINGTGTVGIRGDMVTALSITNFSGNSKALLVNNSDQVSIVNSHVGQANLQVPLSLGIEVGSSTNVTIDGCSVTEASNGIRAMSCTDVLVQNNTVKNVFNEPTRFGGTNIQILNNQVFDDEDTEGSIRCTDAQNVIIQGNVVQGRFNLGNTHNSLIGGPNPSDANTINGAPINGKPDVGGVTLRNSRDNVIQNNIINGSPRFGISLMDNSQDNEFRGNTITNNAGPGIRIIDDNSAIRNFFRENLIYDNGLGFDGLSFVKSGILYNQGAFQQPPTISSVSKNATDITVSGISVPFHEIEVFYNVNEDANPATENAKFFLGSVQADVNGNWTLVVSLNQVEEGDLTLIATASFVWDRTSEFSNPYAFQNSFILGPVLAQPRQSHTYEVPNVRGATYMWWVTSNDGYAIIQSGQGTNKVELLFISSSPNKPSSDKFTIHIQIGREIYSKDVVLESRPFEAQQYGDTVVCKEQTYTYRLTSTTGDQFTWWINRDAQISPGNQSYANVTYGQWFSKGILTAMVQNNLDGSLQYYTWSIVANGCGGRSLSFKRLGNTKLQVEKATAPVLVVVRNMQGQVVQTIEQINTGEVISLSSDLPTGFYIVSLQSSDISENMKIFKK